MTEKPEISVVMSVYNGGDALRATIESILSQEKVSFEYIIVDDGSTDDSAVIISEYARRDERIRVITQANCGLTRSLIRGCSIARGDFIARQDAGDRSSPGRLALQLDRLLARPDAAMISCGSQFIGPVGEELYIVAQNDADASAGLGDLDHLKGPPHHGSVMFRREFYERVGGYRDAFIVAQDLDLWLRLYEHGAVLAVPDVLYEASLAPGAISSVRRRLQIETADTITKCARLRRSGMSDDALVDACAKRLVSVPMRKQQTLTCEAEFYYFIGCTLRKRSPQNAARYLRLALMRRPGYLRAWFALARVGILR